jgi:hypothetical protein
MTKYLASIEIKPQNSKIELVVKDNLQPDWEDRRDVTLQQFADALHDAETRNRAYHLTSAGHTLADQLGMLKHT